MTTAQKTRFTRIAHTIVYIFQRFNLLATGLFSFLYVSFLLYVSFVGEVIRNQVGYQGLQDPSSISSAVDKITDALALSGFKSAALTIILTLALLVFFKEQRPHDKRLALNSGIVVTFCVIVILIGQALVTSLVIDIS